MPVVHPYRGWDRTDSFGLFLSGDRLDCVGQDSLVKLGVHCSGHCSLREVRYTFLIPSDCFSSSPSESILGSTTCPSRLGSSLNPSASALDRISASERQSWPNSAN